MTWKFSVGLALSAALAGCGGNAENNKEEPVEKKAIVAILLFDKSGSNQIDGEAVKKAVGEAVEGMLVRPKGKSGKALFCHGQNMIFCGTIDKKTIHRGLMPLHWELEQFCRAECDDNLPTGECDVKEREMNAKILRRKSELDSPVWAYRTEPPSDKTTTDVLSALVLVAGEAGMEKYGRKTMHVFSDMLTEVRNGRNFDTTPPNDVAEAHQWAQEDWATLKKQYGLKDAGFRGMRAVCHTPKTVKNLQKAALYWRHFFEDVLQTAPVGGL
jgi:hypothetical protein